MNLISYQLDDIEHLPIEKKIKLRYKKIGTT